MEPVHMQLSQKRKSFSQSFSAFFKSSLNFEHSQKKVTPIANVFPKLLTLKSTIR